MLTRAEQRSRAATMRTAGAFGAYGRASPQGVRSALPDPAVSLQPTPPSEVPDISAVGTAVTGVGSTAAGLGAGLAVGGPYGAILGAAAGAIVGLFGMFATSSVARSKAKEEALQAEQIAMANRRAMGQAALEQTRGATRQHAAQQAVTPQQRMVAPLQEGPPGATERIARTLLGG
jgi:hypothetical protein